MKMWNRIAVGVAGAMVLGALAAPDLAKWYVNRRPDVKVGRVEILGWKTYRLTGIHVSRPGLEGDFVQALVDDTAKTVTFEGGEIRLTLPRPSAEGSSGGYKVTLRNVNADVAKDEVTAHLVNLRLGDETCFDRADVVHPRGTASVTQGCFVTKPSAVAYGHAESATVHLNEPLEYVPLQDLRFTGLEVERSSGGGTFKFEGGGDDEHWVTSVKIVKQGTILEVKVGSASATYPKIAANPLVVKDISIVVPDVAHPLDLNTQVQIGSVILTVDPKTRHIWGEATCQEWLESLPDDLRTGPLQEVTFSGRLKFDIALLPKVSVDLVETCKTVGVPPFISALKKPFQYEVYDNKKQEVTRTSGPGSKDWTPLSEVSENMVLALTTTEDPGFFHHHGFIVQAFENSLRDNLKAGRFIRGGSTLSMQLAKNLWLRRSKTLGRKIQEGFLTMALESNLTKAEIFALYLNVVEFGPNTYGIGNASRDLLNTDPLHLTLTQALYLALRLPNPLRTATLEERQGTIQKLIAGMATNGRITDEVAKSEALENDVPVPADLATP